MDIKCFLMFSACFWAVSGTTLEEASRTDFSLILTSIGQHYGEATLTVSLRTGIIFGIRSCGDSRLGIKSIHSDGTMDLTMIYFGTSTNDRIVVKNDLNDETLTSSGQTDPVLKCNSFKFFWITWKDGKLSLGTGRTSNINIGTNIVFTLQPVENLWYDVTQIEFYSGDDFVTHWQLPEDQGENLIVVAPSDATVNRLWKKVYYESDFITFEVRSMDDIRIWLSPILYDKVYELYVRKDPAGSGNYGVGLNKNGAATGPAPSFTDPTALSETFFREYWVSWGDGVISMGRGLVKDQNTLFSWPDPAFDAVYFIAAGAGAEYDATYVFLETSENIYAFASNPAHPGGGNLYDGSLISPRSQKTFFAVQACANVRVAIGTQPLDFSGDEPYFIDIGINNTETHITKGFGIPAVIAQTPNILSCDLPTGFWLSWSNNEIKLGLGLTVNVYTAISYESPFEGELDRFQSVGFYDDHVNGAVFQVFDNAGDQAFIQTYDNLEDQNSWVTVENEFYKGFTLQACSDAYISVSEVPGAEIEYQLILGTGGNPNQLAATKLGVGVVTNITVDGGLLSCDEAREFWVSWMNGVFRFGRGHHLNEDLLLIAADSTQFPINALSLSTGNKQSGIWKFEMDSGDEIITGTANTQPTVVRLYPDVTGFYVRVKDLNAKVTLSGSYAQGASGFSFTFGDGDDTTFTIRNSGGAVVAQSDLATPIHPVYLTDFWISWADGILNAGYGRLINLNPILEDGVQASASPVSVQFSGPGEFYALSEIGSETTFTTSHEPGFNVSYDHFWYKLHRRTTLLFGLTACASASLILSPIQSDISVATTYRIQLGGRNNDIVQVSAGTNIASTYITDLLSCTTERIFWITWTNRVINIGTGNSIGDNIILNIADLPKTIPVNAVTFGVGGNQVATWRVSNNQEPLSSDGGSGGGTSGSGGDGDGGLSAGAVAGIEIGILLGAVLIGGVAFVALKGVPDPVKNVFSNTKEAVDANQQFQHTNLDPPYA